MYNYHNICFIVFRVTLEDLYNGKTSKLKLSKTVICATCKGLVLIFYFFISKLSGNNVKIIYIIT